MSSLSYICGYGSSSEESDASSEDAVKKFKKAKLPTPNLKNVPVVATDDHLDNPELHKGRTRSFGHVRGNWASYVFIKYPEEENISNLISKLLAVYATDDLHVCDDLHISLSRTVTLMYHLITPFTKALQTTVDEIESFHLGFESVKLYCNEENNRTFISLVVDHLSNRHLLKIVKIIDKILADFKLPTFYDVPSVHMSILWANGNKKAEFAGALEKLNDILHQEIDKSLRSTQITKINCKVGNKFFQFRLQ